MYFAGLSFTPVMTIFKYKQKYKDYITNSCVLITLPQSLCLNYCQHVANLFYLYLPSRLGLVYK